MHATPRLHPNHEVTLDLQFDISAVSGQNVNGIPILTNRTIAQSVRLRDDQTSVLSGIMQRNEAHKRQRMARPGGGRPGWLSVWRARQAGIRHRASHRDHAAPVAAGGAEQTTRFMPVEARAKRLPPRAAIGPVPGAPVPGVVAPGAPQPPTPIAPNPAVPEPGTRPAADAACRAACRRTSDAYAARSRSRRTHEPARASSSRAAGLSFHARRHASPTNRISLFRIAMGTSARAERNYFAAQFCECG